VARCADFVEPDGMLSLKWRGAHDLEDIILVEKILQAVQIQTM
jgi:hypothetical protein